MLHGPWTAVYSAAGLVRSVVRSGEYRHDSTDKLQCRGGASKKTVQVSDRCQACMTVAVTLFMSFQKILAPSPEESGRSGRSNWSV